MKKAIIFGASGFVGSHLLGELLSSPDYEQVTAVVRKNLNISHPKLKTLIGDYNSLSALKADISADEIFIALGTTKKDSPNKAEYYQVDHDYPVLAARTAKERGARSVFLVSAVGANPNSNIFYVKTKGENRARYYRSRFRACAYVSPVNAHGEQKKKAPARKNTNKNMVCGQSVLSGEGCSIQRHNRRRPCQSNEERRDKPIREVKGVSLDGNE